MGVSKEVISEFIKNGAQIKQFKGASGIPITRIETISNSELDMARMGYANITNGAEYKDYYIKDGDILMSHINSRAHIGKCALCNVGENQIIHGMIMNIENLMFLLKKLEN